MTWKPLTLALLTGGLLATTEAAAQTTATGTATMTIGTVLFISVTNTSPSFTPVANDLNTGHIAAATTSLVTTRANVGHSVTLRANSDNFTAPSGRTKPSTDLQVSVRPFGGAFGGWSGISSTGSAVTVAAGRAAGDHAASTPEVQYRVLLSYADIPGTYTLGLTYTVAAD